MTYEILLASVLGVGLLVFGIGFMLGRRRKAAQNPRKKAKLPTVESVKALSHALHELALEFVTLIAPWTGPFVNAYLIGEAVVQKLGWSPWVGVPAAFAVETIGIQNVTLALKIYEYEQVRSKSPGKTGPNRGDPPLKQQLNLAMGLSGLYFLTVILLTVVLKLIPTLTDYAPLGFVLLAFSSVVGIGLKSSAQSAFDERGERLAELEAERNRAAQEKADLLKDSDQASVPPPIVDAGPNQNGTLPNGANGQQADLSNIYGQTSDLDMPPVHKMKHVQNQNGTHANGANEQQADLSNIHGQTPGSDMSPVRKKRHVQNKNGTHFNGASGQQAALSNGATTRGAQDAKQALWGLLDGDLQSVSRLSSEIGRSRSTVSRWLTEWTEAGRIERIEIEQDGRTKRWFKKNAHV